MRRGGLESGGSAGGGCGASCLEARGSGRGDFWAVIVMEPFSTHMVPVMTKRWSTRYQPGLKITLPVSDRIENIDSLVVNVASSQTSVSVTRGIML